jgi:RimJ/RimL family protein N-acetyltransferase
LLLRRFTEADADNLFDLDSDSEVMRFLTGGKPTPREVIRNETLPRFLHYYERFEGFGFWAAIEKSTGGFWGGSSSGRRRAMALVRSSSATAQEIRLGQGLRYRRVTRADPQGLH